MLSCKITIGTTGNKHDPLCSSEVVVICSCGWRGTFCESCPDANGKPQYEKRHTNLGRAIYSHLLHDRGS